MAGVISNRIEKAENALKKMGDVSGEMKLIRSPGRVNLIGEHTDYNDGFVLPAAIDREILLAAVPGESVRMRSIDMDSEINFPLTGIKKAGDWGDYARGVAFFLRKANVKPKGFTGALESTIPIGSGLSSSAALEVLVATAFEIFSGLTMEPLDIIKLCRRAENEFVGVNCGIMDQFAVRLGKEKSAVFLDCRTLAHEYIQMPEDVKIVVVDTNVRRSLASSKYNERRAECESAARKLVVKSLRDVSVDEFGNNADKLGEIERKRAKHVVYENSRVLDMKAALRAGDLETCRGLMKASHESLRDDYEVSCFELNIAVGIAEKLNGVYGARMTGAGFGGCTVNLVHEDSIEKFLEVMEREYEIRTGRKCSIYICMAVDGTSEVKKM
jgi:galactokinase